MKSVLQDWVMELPLREQGTLLTCIRGCDLTPKLPLDSMERRLVGALRYAIMHPADPREVDIVGAFFVSTPPRNFRASGIGHYPLHWVSHVMHAAEVIAFRHPDGWTRDDWYQIYYAFVHALHLQPESREDFITRLSEDRIASDTVVS